MYGHQMCLAAMIFLSSVLGGCGLRVPDIKESWDTDQPADPTAKPYPSPKITGTAQIEFEIKRKIYCELKEAVIAVQKVPLLGANSPTGSRTVVRRGLIPRDWGAQIQLTLEVDESSSLNPGMAVNQVLPNATKIFGVQENINQTTLRAQPGIFNSVIAQQSFNLGFGGTFSSTATRIDKFNPYYSIKDLTMPETSTSTCHPDNDVYPAARSSPFFIQSELGIQDWLMGAMYFNNTLTSSVMPSPPPTPPNRVIISRDASRPGGQAQNDVKEQIVVEQSGAGGEKKSGGSPTADVVSYEIKFVIMSNGNVAPTWKLIRFSANTGTTPLFSTGRTRSHDLIITIGPPPTPGSTASNAHLASQIGEAVSSGNRSLVPSQ
jgi:hypothetical protein